MQRRGRRSLPRPGRLEQRELRLSTAAYTPLHPGVARSGPRFAAAARRSFVMFRTNALAAHRETSNAFCNRSSNSPRGTRRPLETIPVRALLRVGRKFRKEESPRDAYRRENFAACLAPLLWLSIERPDTPYLRRVVGCSAPVLASWSHRQSACRRLAA